MERTHSFVLSFLIIFHLLHYSNFSQSEVNKIFSSAGVYEIANLANHEIIPKLKFVLPTIPDSVWIEFERKYDSSALSKQFESILLNHFKDDEIRCYDTLIQNLMSSYSDTTIPRFEYFLEKMDSIRSFIKDADTLLLKLRKDILQSYQYRSSDLFSFDSIKNDILKKVKKEKNRHDNFPSDSLLNFYKYFADTILNKFFQEPKPFPEIPKFPDIPFPFFDFKDFDKYFQRNKEFLDFLKEQSKVLNEYISMQGKIMKEYFDLMSKYMKDLSSGKHKSQKDLEKKFGKKLKELENKIEKLKKEFEKKFKDLEQKQKYLEPRTKELNYYRERNYEDSYAKLKKLVGKHYKFIENLILLKKQIEMEILQDLQKKGFINVEVQQN